MGASDRSLRSDKQDRLAGSSSDRVVHLIILVRGGKRMKVTGVAGRPLEELPYCLPPPGTAGLNEYEIAGLAKEMERVYGTALSAETTWDVRDCETDPWPPLEDITVIAVLDGRHRGLPFEDPGRYWFDIKWSGPRAFRDICVCAVRKRQ